MSASAAPIPLDQFALAITDLEIPQLLQETARLENSLYHLERSNTTLQEYPDDDDCKDAIRYNLEVIQQQNQRISLLRMELRRRGVNLDHLERQPAAGAPTQANTDGQPAAAATTTTTNGTSSTNGHAAEEEEGVHL